MNTNAMEMSPKLASCSCSQRQGGFRGFPRFKSDALFLVDPHQRAQLDMAGLQDYIDAWFSLPKVDVERVHKFVHSFRAASFCGEVEGSTVYINEEYVAACLKLVNSANPDAAPDGEKNIHRVSAKSLVEFREYVEECFEGGSQAEVSGKGWRTSLLRGSCKDIVNFLQQRMWWTADNAEFVDDVVVQAALGIMTGKQFGWAKFLSRQMKEDILEYLDGDEGYRSTVGLRSAQYLSMLIEFQAGAKQEAADIGVSIFDVDEMLEEKQKQISALLKKLAELEEQVTVLCQEAARASTNDIVTKEQVEFQLLKSEQDLAQLQTYRIEDQKVATRQVEEEKAYSKVVYRSYRTLKSKNCKLQHELKEANNQNLTLVQEVNELKESTKESQHELKDCRIKNLNLLKELNELKETTIEKREATKQKLGDAVKDFENQREPIAMQVPLRGSLQFKCHGVGVVQGKGTVWEAIWAAGDDLYLGHFSNLFDNWEDDFPYPKWEALWWIAKDYGQSPPPPRHPSLNQYYSRNSLGMSLKPPEEVANHPDFCKSCDRRWMWFKDGKLDGVYYNWPKIQIDLSSSTACSASYYRFYEKHKDHRDPVCFRASIFCAVLAHWCSVFDLIIDANKGGQHHQDMMLYIKLNYCSCRTLRVLELMCQSQFLFDSHRNMVIDNGTRWGIAEEWRRVQRNAAQNDSCKGHDHSNNRYGKKPRPS